MRKPHNYDQELKALNDKAKLLKERKIRQLGELVIATGADVLEPDTLTGALLSIVEVKDPAKKEAWRNRGRAFFRGRSRGKGRRGDLGNSEAAASTQPATRGDGANTNTFDTNRRSVPNDRRDIQQPEARGPQSNAAGDQQSHGDDTSR